MAAITAVTIALQSRDWESIIGIIFNTTDAELRDMMLSLQNQYKALLTKPLATDIIPVVTTESVILKIVPFIYGVSVSHITKDIGGSTFNRVMTALRLLNNITDNFIATSMVTLDASFAATAVSVKKTGRQMIMNTQYDNQ